MRSIVWASCFLAPGDKIYGIFSRLNDQLKPQGMQLVLFSNHDLSGDNIGCPTIKVPFLISETGSEFREFYHGDGIPASASQLHELAAVDVAWGLRNIDAQSELDTLRAISFWERAFKLMQPSAILTWGSAAPLARMWMSLARRRQRPLFVIERGVYENTLTYSVAGQGALSDFSTSLSMVDPTRDEEELHGLWSKIEAYYAANDDRHYAHTNRSIDAEALGAIERLERPRVLYLGSNDPGSCASFGYRDFGDLQAPFVSKSKVGLEKVVEALSRMGEFAGSLMYKPHIGTQFTIETTGVSFPVQKFTDLDVYSLIEQADVVVTMTSTTSFSALLKGKPTVTLANTQFMGREVTYEARSIETLISALRGALVRDAFEERLERGRLLIAAAFREVLVGLEEDVPTRYKLDDLATLIGRFRFYVGSDFDDITSRLEAFTEFYKQARAGELPASGSFHQGELKELRKAFGEAMEQLELVRARKDRAETELQTVTGKSIDVLSLLAPLSGTSGGGWRSELANIRKRARMLLALVGVGSQKHIISYKLYDPEERTLVENSGYFDRGWYRSTYPKIAASGIDPLVHFMWIGAFLGYNPSSQFDIEAYVRENPDVAQANINPLVHYLRSGESERRTAHPVA